MSFDSVDACIQSLRHYRLLSAVQLEEINQNIAEFANPRALAQELLKAGWLTPYQVNTFFTGRGQELVLGSYILLERLGEGGVGHVFKARHIYMQRMVALKFLRADMTENNEVVGRFYREIQAVSQMVHPNVVQAHDAGPCGSTHFLAMEYVQGTDLQKLVGQKGALPIDQACDYIRQASLGLQHIFEQGLIHRDIKPSNFLVTEVEHAGTAQGQSGAASALALGQSYPFGLIKILDLGLARFDEPEDAGEGGPLTQAGEGGLRGSADYLAPEQAVDFHNADIRADIYSLGCTFYFLLTGQAPFEGGSLAVKLMKHQNAVPAALDKVRKGVPRKLAQIVERMLAKKADQRFQTPAEVAAAVAAVGQRGWLGMLRGS